MANPLVRGLLSLTRPAMKQPARQIENVLPEEKGLSTLKPFKKVKEGTSLKKIFNKNDKDIEQWKEDNKNPLAGERRYRDKELEEAARKLNEDKISVEDFIKIRDERKPLKTYGTVPGQ